MFNRDELTSCSKKLSLYLAFAKLEAVISGCNAPISFTTSPINESKLSLFPFRAKLII
jgi:hypothetical protein